MTWRRALVLGWVLATLALATSWGSAARSGALMAPLFERWGLSASQAQTAHVALRKAGHVAAYAAFALLVHGLLAHGPLAQRALRGRPGRRRQALLAAFALALADEGMQALWAARGGSAADVLLDTAGAALALALTRRAAPAPSY